MHVRQQLDLLAVLADDLVRLDQDAEHYWKQLTTRSEPDTDNREYETYLGAFYAVGKEFQRKAAQLKSLYAQIEGQLA